MRRLTTILSLFAMTLAIIMPYSAKATGGETGGGGGIECKRRFMKMAKSLESLVQSPSARVNKGYVEALLDVINPEKNPQFRIEVLDQPIQNCPQTSDALACSWVKKNIIQINCGTNGLPLLPALDQYQHVIHEISWWVNKQYDDSNYFYSIDLANALNIPATDSEDPLSFEYMHDRFDRTSAPANVTQFQGEWMLSGGFYADGTASFYNSDGYSANQLSFAAIIMGNGAIKTTAYEVTHSWMELNSTVAPSKSGSQGPAAFRLSEAGVGFSLPHLDPATGSLDANITDEYQCRVAVRDMRSICQVTLHFKDPAKVPPHLLPYNHQVYAYYTYMGAY